MKSSALSIVMYILVSPLMAETPHGIVYTVRLENGASQWYQIVAPSSIPPANAAKWATPSLSHSKLSPQGAGIVAVGWAGGQAACQNVQRVGLLMGCPILGVMNREDSITHRV
jgi:hypothetical protein